MAHPLIQLRGRQQLGKRERVVQLSPTRELRVPGHWAMRLRGSVDLLVVSSLFGVPSTLVRLRASSQEPQMAT